MFVVSVVNLFVVVVGIVGSLAFVLMQGWFEQVLCVLH